MSGPRTSRPAGGEAAGRDPAGQHQADIEYGVLLASGLVMPAAGEAIAAEQADRLGGIHCHIKDGGAPCQAS